MNISQFTEIEHPTNYWTDEKGILTPESLVSDIDKIRDEVVGNIIKNALEQHKEIHKFKAWAFSEISSFLDLSANEYGVAQGGKKGNVTLYSFDGAYKIIVSTQEKITFDERLQVAKSLIDECIRDWMKGSRPEICAMVSRAFQIDKTGKINVGEVLKLRRLESNDERWKMAMKAIGESVQVVGSKRHMRFYKRSSTTGYYEAISLDMASI